MWGMTQLRLCYRKEKKTAGMDAAGVMYCNGVEEREEEGKREVMVAMREWMKKGNDAVE